MTLRVGLLTSWNTRCGIAEYSRSLAGAMRRRGDVEVTVFGSRNVGDRAVREYEDWAVPSFEVQLWTPGSRYAFDADAVLEPELDVLHIQYSNVFYRRRQLVEVMRRFSGVLAITWHDKYVPRTFPWRMADLLYAHREDIGAGPRRIIPQGIEVRPPVIKTFGLGKSRTDIIGEICERNGWLFESSFGENRWLDTEELRAWLRDSDAIVLWYDEDRSSGGSAAVPMALSTRRPVFVNDTEWFRDLPERTTMLTKVSTPEQLEAAMRDRFVDDYAEPRSWDRVAETLVRDYKAVLADGGPGRRQPVRSRLFSMTDDKPLIRRKRQLLGHPFDG
jgi:hypothetical protein